MSFHLRVGLLHGLTGSTLDHRSLPPEFESQHEQIWRMFHLWFCFIIFGGLSANFAYHVHKSGHKTSMMIITTHAPSVIRSKYWDPANKHICAQRYVWLLLWYILAIKYQNILYIIWEILSANKRLPPDLLNYSVWVAIHLIYISDQIKQSNHPLTCVWVWYEFVYA